MPITGGLTYARPDSMYAGAPVEEYKALNQEASDQYNKTRQAKDALDVLYDSIDVREQDAPIKKRAIDGLRNKFSELVANGNYQDAQYVVAQAHKDFLMDKELQGAGANRKREVDYHTKLNERLQKGEITPDAYAYGMVKSKATNDKPLQYNKDTYSYDNLYQGANILNDQSKDIYDNTYKRIADWKASSTPITLPDGRKVAFKIDPTGVGFAYDMITQKAVDEGEVFNALKTEVEKEYAPFLQQERDVEDYKKFYDPNTKTVRPVSRGDVPLIDEDLKSLASGVSKSTLKSLEAKAAKGDKGAKTAYQKALDQYNDVDVNNLDNDTLQKAYKAYQTKSQIDRYVYPAASKAGFTELDHKIIEDKRAEMALAHKYKKAEITYEKSYLAPLPSSNSQLEEFTAQDYQKAVEQDKQVKGKLVEANQRLELAKKDGNKVYIDNAQKEVDDLTHLYETAQNRQVDFVKNLSKKDPNVAKEYIIANIGDIVADVVANPNKYNTVLGGEIKRLITREGMGGTSGGGTTAAATGGAGSTATSQIDRSTAEHLAGVILNSPEKDKVITKAVKAMGNSNTTPAEIVDAIQEAKTKGLSISYQTDVFGIDDNTDKSWEKPITDRVGDLVKNTASNWLVGDVSLDEIVSGESNFKFVNEKGDEVKPDLSKSIVRPQINHISGLNTVRILFKDSEGKPVYRSADKKSQAAMTLTPSDQNGLSSVYKQLGENLKASQDGNAKKQGVKILGYTKFGSSLSSIYLSNMEPKEEKAIILPSSQGDLYAKIVKGPGGFEAYIKPDGEGDYVPFTLKGYDGKKTSTFGSKEQFEELLALNNY